MVVTGRGGQIVRSLVEQARGTEFEIVPAGRPGLDLIGHAESITSTLEEAHPDVLVSAAAYTQVDKAEREPEIAFAVNEHGARAVAHAARTLGVPLIHLSTDYVFDGTKSSPYTEEDQPHPTSIYGASKLAGEQAVLAEHKDCAILRTAWVYSPFGTNFVKTMLGLAEDHNEVAVVADQHGNPTNAFDIAEGIFAVARNLRRTTGPQYRGLFHMTARGEANWAEVAEAAFAASTNVGGPSASVRHISTADYPTAARRPANSRLNSAKLERIHGVRLRDWHVSLQRVVDRLVTQPTQSKVSQE